MRTNSFLDSARRSLAGAAPRLILASALSILVVAVAHPVPTAAQERDAHLQQAIDELLDGRPLPAVADASQAVEESPRSAEALAILGLSQLKCGEWEKAESRFNAALAIDSLLPEAHLGLGIIAASTMHYRDALPHLRRATSSRLLPGAAYRALGTSLEDLNLHEEASRAIREAEKYSDDINTDLQGNVRAFADIFAAHEGRSLYVIPKDFRSTSVRLRYVGNNFTVPVVVNGSTPRDFIFDTGHGGTLMLSDEHAASLDLTYLGEIKTNSMAGPLRLKAAVLDSVRIGGLVMRDVPVFVCQNYPFDFAGLVGWKLINKVNTTIDFEKQQIRFSSQDEPRPPGAEGTTTCVPFAYLTSMYIIARFGDEIPRAFVFDTGAGGSFLHGSHSDGSEAGRAGAPATVRIGDLTFEVPQLQFIDFTAIHRTGRYYFPGIIGPDILRHSVLHILPRESMLCIEKGES